MVVEVDGVDHPQVEDHAVEHPQQLLVARDGRALLPLLAVLEVATAAPAGALAQQLLLLRRGLLDLK